MFTNLTDSAKAFLFFALAFGLTVTASLLLDLSEREVLDRRAAGQGNTALPSTSRAY